MTSYAPSRAAGLSRLHDFLPRAGRAYAARRNYDLGPESRENVSGLSPYIRHRLVTEPEIVQQVLAHHPASDAEIFLHEVLWRTYWKGWLELRPQVWQAYRAAVMRGQQQLVEDARLATRYAQAITGHTGIACYDAWLTELVERGYLHNHARMWFASIWIFTLKLPWALGADWFYRHLLDGDPASNTLSWRWVAGLHTPGKHYVARAANIRTYTAGRFDPSGQLDEHASPIGEAQRHTPGVYDTGDVVPTDTRRCGLLVFPDDLTPERSELQTLRLHAAAGFCSGAVADAYGWSSSVRQFAERALRDCQARVSSHFNVDMTTLDHQEPIAACLQWCHQYRLQGVVVLKPTQGPWTELCAPLATCLRENGVPLFQVRRQWDSVLHPYATAGYFAFKRKIPHLFTRLAQWATVA